jgi:cysteine desulfurase
MACVLPNFNPVGRVYFDNNATTPILPQALEALTEFTKKFYGNPSGMYAEGEASHRGLEWARCVFSRYMSVEPASIYFTSCGTEANNIAIRSVMSMAAAQGRNVVVTSNVEHASIMRTAATIQGCKHVMVPVTSSGYIDEVWFRRTLETHGRKVGMVSVILAQNEVGTLQRIPALSQIVREVLGPHVPFHTDATQALGKYYLNPKALGVDMLTGSAHKFHGPRGAGILYAREGLLNPQVTTMTGGGQERGCRSGTENVAAICAAATAFESMLGDPVQYKMRVKSVGAMRDRILGLLRARIPEIIVNGDPQQGLYNTLSVSFPRGHGHAIREYLDKEGVAVGSGSACSKGKNSDTVMAMLAGNPDAERIAHGTIRISLSAMNTAAECDYLVAKLAEAYETTVAGR